MDKVFTWERFLVWSVVNLSPSCKGGTGHRWQLKIRPYIRLLPISCRNSLFPHKFINRGLHIIYRRILGLAPSNVQHITGTSIVLWILPEDFTSLRSEHAIPTVIDAVHFKQPKSSKKHQKNVWFIISFISLSVTNWSLLSPTPLSKDTYLSPRQAVASYINAQVLLFTVNSAVYCNNRII